MEQHSQDHYRVTSKPTRPLAKYAKNGSTRDLPNADHEAHQANVFRVLESSNCKGTNQHTGLKQWQLSILFELEMRKT